MLKARHGFNNPVKYSDPTGHAPEEYSQAWWEARYYALELWKYEDPGVNELTNSIVRGDNPLDVLARYGIRVTVASNEITGSETRSAFLTLMNAVRTTARALNPLMGGSWVSNFKDVFGDSTHFVLWPGETSSGNATWGTIGVDAECDGFSGCNEKSSNEIHFGIDALLEGISSENVETTDLGLVIHELAHEVERRGIYFKDVFAAPFASSARDWARQPNANGFNMGVRAGGYDYWSSIQDGADSELSADAIATYVLFVDMRQDAYLSAYMDEVASTAP